MKADDKDRITKCARDPLHLRRAAINYWNPYYLYIRWHTQSFLVSVSAVYSFLYRKVPVTPGRRI